MSETIDINRFENELKANVPSEAELDAMVKESNLSEDLKDGDPNDPMNTPEVNKASEVFTNALPKVKALAANMRAGSLGRVFNSVMEFPLGEGYPKFRSKAENELFIMALSLLQAKNMMIAATVENMRRQQELTQEAITNAANAVANESNNGTVETN